MNAVDVVGYSFDGALYCPAHVPQANETRCTCGDVDESGACLQNCHGYGPNVVFANMAEAGDVCDVCGGELLG